MDAINTSSLVSALCLRTLVSLSIIACDEDDDDDDATATV